MQGEKKMNSVGFAKWLFHMFFAYKVYSNYLKSLCRIWISVYMSITRLFIIHSNYHSTNIRRVSWRPDLGARDVPTGHIPDIMRVLTRNPVITVECNECNGNTRKRQLNQDQRVWESILGEQWCAGIGSYWLTRPLVKIFRNFAIQSLNRVIMMLTCINLKWYKLY